MAQGKIVLERPPPSVKHGDAVLQVQLFTEEGKTVYRYRLKSFTGNAPRSVRATFGDTMLDLLRARFGGIVTMEKD